MWLIAVFAGLVLDYNGRTIMSPLSSLEIRLCILRIAALQQSLFRVQRKLVLWFSSKQCISSRRASISDGPLLLPRGVCQNCGTPPPSRCSVLFESLPHLLPRQAFSFWDWLMRTRDRAAVLALFSLLSDEKVISSRTGRLNGRPRRDAFHDGLEIRRHRKDHRRHSPVLGREFLPHIGRRHQPETTGYCPIIAMVRCTEHQFLMLPARFAYPSLWNWPRRVQDVSIFVSARPSGRSNTANPTFPM